MGKSKLVNTIYFSRNKNSEIFLLNLSNSKIYVLSHILITDLDRLLVGCETDSIDSDLLKFLSDEGLIA